MRLHKLQATAFGPFADTVTVDFDELSSAGLFLLSGPTGAGKTSVLDAVCFALYGDVPGDRGSAKRLRSDHAASDCAPEVTLEVTLSGRRFRLVRSPAWERAKKRGTGLTTQQASVTLAELRQGQWVTLSTRLDETGHLITNLVGMNLTQFTQVAMLPQGRFQAFLRARSDERHHLLQQLFRTGRFEDVEQWLRERRVQLRRQSEAVHHEVVALVNRVSEATEEAPPEAWDLNDLDAPAAAGQVLAWASDLRDAAVHQRMITADQVTAAAADEGMVRKVYETARSQHEGHARVAGAVAERATLQAQSMSHHADRRALDAARRASTVGPVLQLATAARAAHTAATKAAQTQFEVAGRELGLTVVDETSLSAAAEHATERAAVLRAAVPREQRWRAITAEITDAEGQLRQLQQRDAALSDARESAPARVASLRSELAQAHVAAQEGALTLIELDQLEARLAGHRQLAELEPRLSAAQATLAEASHTTLSLWEGLLVLRQARLEGMAAEIAGALAAGASCPVCGSEHHPHKASPTPGAPDADAERTAVRRLDDAKAAELICAEQVRDLQTQVAVARHAAGEGTADEVAAQRDGAASRLAQFNHQAGRVPELEAALSQAQAELEDLQHDVGEVAVKRAALESALESLRTEQASTQAEFQALLDGAPTLSAALDLQQLRAAVAREARRAQSEAAAAAQALAEAEAALAAAVTNAGFESVPQATEALRSERELADLEARVVEYQQRLAAVTAILSEPGAQALAEAQAPDLAGLEQVHAAALDRLGAAREEAAQWVARAERLSELAQQLGDQLSAWAPVRTERELVSGLASFVEGKSSDNRLQMRLSAYVLAYRLSQVVAAANERLSRMSDQRYTLQHIGERGAGETRGGLSLAVCDEWTGESRDPATLSGGETFVVSLALALGLADVITQEAGGADLDTLFVDEGFGSLDAETLDQVMDTLDSLRGGGRVVGVVSHVPEMRDRIPVQLHVIKQRSGSSLSMQHDVA